MFAAWTDADAFCQWFGPDGFTCTVREMDVRPGGRARFDMVSGDGTEYTNRFDYLEGRLLKQLREGAAELRKRHAQILASRARLKGPLQAAYDVFCRAQLEQ